MNKNKKTGKSGEPVHHASDGPSSVKWMSPTAEGPLSAFYSTGPVLSLKPVVQPKLTIGKPNDKYEQEADLVADQVMQMSEPEKSLENGTGLLISKADEPIPTVQRQTEEGQNGDGGKQIVFYANGWDHFRNDQDEIEAITRGGWLTDSDDFKQTAEDTQSDVVGISTSEEFFSTLRSESQNIKRIVYIGHSDEEGLNLSLYSQITVNELNDWDNQEAINEIKTKLASDATIDLYACDAAAGTQFMRTMAQTFGVKVRGFQSEIYWCVDTGFDKDGNEIITSRGLISPKLLTGCSSPPWYKGANQLIPPVEVLP